MSARIVSRRGKRTSCTSNIRARTDRQTDRQTHTCINTHTQIHTYTHTHTYKHVHSYIFSTAANLHKEERGVPQSSLASSRLRSEKHCKLRDVGKIGFTICGTLAKEPLKFKGRAKAHRWNVEKEKWRKG